MQTSLDSKQCYWRRTKCVNNKLLINIEIPLRVKKGVVNSLKYREETQFDVELDFNLRILLSEKMNAFQDVLQMFICS